MLVSGHAVGEKGEKRNNSTARALFGVTKEEEDRKKILNEEETLVGKQPVLMHFDIILLRPIRFLTGTTMLYYVIFSTRFSERTTDVFSSSSFARLCFLLSARLSIVLPAGRAGER